jgi:hypothetical protein
MVMAHEIDHALQDQSFDLDKYMKPVKDDNDQQLAHTAVAEGDGVALMVEFMLKESGQKVQPWADDRMVNMFGNLASMSAGGEFDKAPLFMREVLVFPYTYGLKLVAQSRKTHPWSDVDAMYRNPPMSTEQVMHPEKYRAGEKPVPVKIPALAPFKGWKKVYGNTVGELMWGVLLREHGVEKERAEKAAAGWGGDHVEVYVNGGETVGVVLSVWDAEMDAVEMQTALEDAVVHMAGAAKADEKTDEYASVSDASGHVWWAERKGSAVVLVVGAAKDVAAKLRTEIWSKWKH